MFSIAVLPHSPGVVQYHLLLRQSFGIGIWGLFVHRGQKSYTPTSFGKLWTTPGHQEWNMPHHKGLVTNYGEGGGATKQEGAGI